MQDAQTLRRNFLWNTFGQLTYMLCQFLCGILVVRLAGEQVSGVYNTALTATGIFLSIASYGMYSFQVSDIRGKYGASTYIRSRVWTCALAVALCIGFVAVSALTGENPYSAQQSVCVLLFLGYRMVESLTDIYNAIDQRSGRLDIVGKTYAVRGAVTLASFTLTLWLTQDIVLTLALMLGASLVVFFVYSLPQARAFYAPEQPQNARVAALLWECLPLAVYSFLNTTTASIPKLALSSRMGETALGIYGPVTQPVVLLQVGATYLFNPFITVFADSYARRQKGLFQGGVRRAGHCAGAAAPGPGCGAFSGTLGAGDVRLARPGRLPVPAGAYGRVRHFDGAGAFLQHGADGDALYEGADCGKRVRHCRLRAGQRAVHRPVGAARHHLCSRSGPAGAAGDAGRRRAADGAPPLCGQRAAA